MSAKADRLVTTLPSTAEVDRRIGELLRELHLAKRLLRLAKQADHYREIEARRDTRSKQARRRPAAVAG